MVASILRWLVSVVKTLSGLCATLRRNKTMAPSTEIMPPIKQPARPAPQKSSSYSEWEKCISGIVSLAKQEIAEILPGWSIDIHTLKSPDMQCYEFVLRAETPLDWSLDHCDRDGRIVQGRPSEQWGARLLIPHREIHMSKSLSAQLVHKRLSEFANDIRRKVLALGYIDDKPVLRFDYRKCNTCNAFLMPRESGYFTCARCTGARITR